MNNLAFIQLFDPTPFSCQNWPIRDQEGCTVGQFSQIFACFSLIYWQKSMKIGQNVYLDQLNQSYYYNFLIRPLLHAKTSKYMAEKAATRVNFRRFSLVSLSFINRSPWKLVKMCILISLTNHITTTFWSHHFYMPEQANIWQKRLRRGSIFADFHFFLLACFGKYMTSYEELAVIWLVIS